MSIVPPEPGTPVAPPAAAFSSSIAGLTWPAFVSGTAANLLAIQYQLTQSERWPEAELRRHQLRQLDAVLRHCWTSVPFYRERLAAAGWGDDSTLTPELWARLPVLTRREVQDAGETLHSSEPPPGHGRIGTTRTSGSTGMPLQTPKTTLASFYWYSFMVREHLWHRRDPRLKLAVIRPDRNEPASAPLGRAQPDWGKPIALMYPTGPAAYLDIRSSFPDQAAWLQREDPGYLLTFPSNVTQLARHCLAHAIRPQGLRQVRTFGEVVSEDTRTLCRQAWGAELVDVYSAEEIGYIALQCPEQGSYHVQSEGVLVEILTDDGRPCREGEIGRVVVSPLHNFAMPLLRYALGDYAEAGPPCSCGRTLPVLRRILGKSRNLLTLPSGERRYAYHGGRAFIEIPAIVQFQLVQRTPSAIDLRLVTRRPLTQEEEMRARQAVLAAFRHPFDLRIVYVDAIARSPSGKFEDFMSALT